MKTCSKCGNAKSVKDFNKNRNRPDGYAHWCRQCANLSNSKYKKANRGKINKYQKEWRTANPGKTAVYRSNHKSYYQKYYAVNKEFVLRKNREYQEAHKEQIIENRRRWDKIHGSGHRARAKRFGVKYEPINKTKIFERDNWTCGLCSEPVDKTTSWPDLECATLDHIVPMSQSGDHTESNVQLAHFCCNLLKRNEHPEIMLEM